jgi:hypothetical protein
VEQGKRSDEYLLSIVEEWRETQTAREEPIPCDMADLRCRSSRAVVWLRRMQAAVLKHQYPPNRAELTLEGGIVLLWQDGRNMAGVEYHAQEDIVTHILSDVTGKELEHEIGAVDKWAEMTVMTIRAWFDGRGSLGLDLALLREIVR